MAELRGCLGLKVINQFKRMYRLGWWYGYQQCGGGRDEWKCVNRRGEDCTFTKKTK